MGFWNETCIITQQGFSDADAYCVVADCQSEFVDFPLAFTDAEIAIGKLNCYGELEDIISRTTEAKIFTTDYYHKKYPKKAVLFAQKSAWDAVVSYVKEHGWRYTRYTYIKENYDRLTQYLAKQPTELHFEWYLVSRFLRAIRRSYLHNNMFTGSDNCCDKELAFANSLITVREEEV